MLDFVLIQLPVSLFEAGSVCAYDKIKTDGDDIEIAIRFVI